MPPTLPHSDPEEWLIHSSSPLLLSTALAYLRQWAKEREAWKFQKVKQTWLIKHAFHPDQLDRSAFRHLVHYLSGIQGAARDRLLEQCRSIKAQPRPETPSVDSPTKEDDNEDNDKNKEDGSVLKDQEGASPSIQADSSLKDAQETWEERRRRAKKIIKALEGNR